MEEYYAVTDRNLRVLGIETSDFLSPSLIKEPFENPDIDLFNSPQDRVREKYPFDIFMFKNAFPLGENEKRTIETAFKKGKKVYLKFPHTAPVTIPVQNYCGLTTLTTFYLQEPFNPYLLIK